MREQTRGPKEAETLDSDFPAFLYHSFIPVGPAVEINEECTAALSDVSSSGEPWRLASEPNLAHTCFRKRRWTAALA
jgi:hypothetical protein